MSKRLLVNVLFDSVVVWPALVGGLWYGIDMLENVAYFVLWTMTCLGLVVGPTMLVTKDEKVKSSVKEKTEAHAIYVKISSSAEVLFLVATGNILLGALYMLSVVFVTAGQNKIAAERKQASE